MKVLGAGREYGTLRRRTMPNKKSRSFERLKHVSGAP